MCQKGNLWREYRQYLFYELSWNRIAFGKLLFAACKTCVVGNEQSLTRKKRGALFADDAAVAFQISFCLTIKAPLLWHIMREKQGGVLYVPYVLMSKWTYLCQNAKRTTNSFACPLVYWFTHQLVNLFVRPAANTPADVNYSVRNLTLWVPFLLTNVRLAAKNRFSRRLVLMKKGGNPWMQQNEFLFKETAACTRFCAICS